MEMKYVVSAPELDMYFPGKDHQMIMTQCARRLFTVRFICYN